LFLNSGFVSVIVAGLTPLIVLTILLAGIGYHAVAWQPPALWTEDLRAGALTAVGADSGGAYVGGYAIRSLFLSRYDLGGQRVWNQDFGNSTYDRITEIALGTDGVYAAGYAYNSGFIRKYGFNGSFLWTANDPRLDTDVSVSADSGQVFAGFYDGRTAIIRSYDIGGNSLWTANIGNSSRGPDPQTYWDVNHVYTIGPNIR
jgi:hypothetical protein